MISILLIFILNPFEVFVNEEKGKIYMVLEYCCAVLKDMLDQVPSLLFTLRHYYLGKSQFNRVFTFSEIDPSTDPLSISNSDA